MFLLNRRSPVVVIRNLKERGKASKRRKNEDLPRPPLAPSDLSKLKEKIRRFVSFETSLTSRKCLETFRPMIADFSLTVEF